MMKYRGAKYNENGTINVEINHPQFGWLWFTANPNDPEPHGRQIFEDLKDEAEPFE